MDEKPRWVTFKVPNIHEHLQKRLHQLGGYFKRFKGGALERWAEHNGDVPTFGLEARATLAFLQVGQRSDVGDQVLTSSSGR